MKSFSVILLSNNSIEVGKVSHQTKVAKVFHTESIDLLEKFSKENKNLLLQLEKAFAYWVLCKLGRCKEENQRYGKLKRKIIAFSEKLWKQIRSCANRVAKSIKKYQKTH
jgi:hypothetical protein